MTVHLRQDQVARDAEHHRVLPRGVGNQVVHRLVPRPHVPRIDPRGHGLDALPLPRQAQSGQVGTQRLVPIPVPKRLRQPVYILPEPPFAGIA